MGRPRVNEPNLSRDENRAAYLRQWKEENKEWISEYRKETRDRRLSKKREWYYKNKEHIAEYSRKYQAENRERISARRRAANQRNREKNKTYERERLMREYGISVVAYEEMKTGQGSKCAICKAIVTGTGRKGLHVDHCHVTGKVRALLCSRCNTTLGNMKDDPALLRAAAEYLEGHR